MLKAQSMGVKQSFLFLPLCVLLDRPPQSFEPFSAIDASSQKLLSVWLTGFTTQNPLLEPKPGMALKWISDPSQTKWSLVFPDKILDTSGHEITLQDVAHCLGNYKEKNWMPFWSQIEGGTQNLSRTITLYFTKPSPFVPRDLSTLYFYRQEGKPVCSRIDPDLPLIGYGGHLISPAHISQLQKTTRIKLGALDLQFSLDESSRALSLLRGDCPLAFNAFSPSKTQWFKRARTHDFLVLDGPGSSVNFLAFNLSDPILKDRSVRIRIAQAIDRDQIVRGLGGGIWETAHSLLPPTIGGLTKSDVSDFSKQNSNNEPPLKLRFLATTSQIGLNQALVVKEMLKKANIELEIQTLETAQFASALKKGSYQLLISRWVGVGDTSIVYSTLHSQGNRNRFHYSDSQMDQMLERLLIKPSDQKLLKKIQLKVLEDLPYLPLWRWNNTLIVSKKHLSDIQIQYGIKQIEKQGFWLNGGLETLSGFYETIPRP